MEREHGTVGVEQKEGEFDTGRILVSWEVFANLKILLFFSLCRMTALSQVFCILLEFRLNLSFV